MKRRIVVLGVLSIMLFLALSGTAGAQDNPFPSGSNFLFLPDVRTAPVPQPSATIDELHPVKLVLPGPCLPSGECPTLDRGFVVREMEAVEYEGTFLSTKYSRIETLEKTTREVKFVYKCFIDDCMPMFKEVSSSAWTQNVDETQDRKRTYAETPIIYPPGMDEGVLRQMEAWWRQTISSRGEVIMPSFIPVAKVAVLGNVAAGFSCTGSMMPGSVIVNSELPQNVYFDIAGVYGCQMNGAIYPGIVLQWHGYDTFVYDKEGHVLSGLKHIGDMNGALFVGAMNANGAIMLPLGQLKQFSREIRLVANYSPVLDEIWKVSPRNPFQIPDFGYIAVLGAAIETARLALWTPTVATAEALTSWMVVYIPDDAICPTFDLSPSDNIPPMSLCGAYGDNTGIPQ